MVIISFLMIMQKLYYWQVIKGSELSQVAKNQYIVEDVILEKRGRILASDRSYLVSRKTGWIIYIVKDKINTILDTTINDLLSDIFPDDLEKRESEKARIISIINNSTGNWIPIISRLEESKKILIEKRNMEGVEFEKQEISNYPEASAAAHLLGFVGKNDKGEDIGYFGLEGYYDLLLSGRPYYEKNEKKWLSNALSFFSRQNANRFSGVDLLTTIIKPIQIKMESKLAEGIGKYGAKSGSVIIMDPHSGAVLAIASYPSYDPREYYDFSNEQFINPIVSSVFEPGSIFKILIMSSALDSKVLDTQDICKQCGGPVVVDGYSIQTWDDKYYPDSSMTDIIVHSDNVGMVYVSKQLGKEKMITYLQKFGLGSLTGIDLQGETSQKLRLEKDWRPIDAATVSFGQGIAVTPIQMITASSTIANGGHLIKPHIVSKLLLGSWEEDTEHFKNKRVISEKAAREVAYMMVEAAKSGEAKWTYLRGYKVAGKTGTAQIPIEGHYDKDKTVASFIGFAPYDNPKFIMLVTLYEPTTSPWASETAAPLWYFIAKDLFLYYGLTPES